MISNKIFNSEDRSEVVEAKFHITLKLSLKIERNESNLIGRYCEGICIQWICLRDSLSTLEIGLTRYISHDIR